MESGATGLLYRAVQCCAADIDFIAPLVSRLPDLAARKVSVSANGLFKAYNHFWQLPAIKVIVQKAEHFFQLSGYAACLDGLFHTASVLSSLKVYF